MKVMIEVDGDAVMETLGKGVERGDIAHWAASATYHKRDGDRAPWIAVEEKLEGRKHTIKHRLGERALKAGLESRQCVALPMLERGDATPMVVDTLIQHCLFERKLHPHPESTKAD